MKDVDAVIVRSDIIDEEVIKAAGKLKIAVRAGAGYDNIDLKAASAKGSCGNEHTRARMPMQWLNLPSEP